MSAVEDLKRRLETLQSGLRARGVTEACAIDFCNRLAGKCAVIQACCCKGHELGAVPLPPGRMCSREFHSRLQDILHKLKLVAGKIEACRQVGEQLSASEVGAGFLTEQEGVVHELKRRRMETAVVETHEKGLYLKLLNERFELLTQWEPIDVEEHKEFCLRSLHEMSDILQTLKAPRLPIPDRYLKI